MLLREQYLRWVSESINTIWVFLRLHLHMSRDWISRGGEKQSEFWEPWSRSWSTVIREGNGIDAYISILVGGTQVSFSFFPHSGQINSISYSQDCVFLNWTLDQIEQISSRHSTRFKSAPLMLMGCLGFFQESQPMYCVQIENCLIGMSVWFSFWLL